MVAQPGKSFDFAGSPQGTRAALRASGSRAKRFRDAPAAYVAELDELDSRIGEDDEEVKLR